MSKRKYRDLEKENIKIQRSYNYESNQKEYRVIETDLKDVSVRKGLIEEYYKEAILVDFANKNIGGGVLNRGSVQEEILFCVFPELLACICFCFKLED